MGERSIGSCSSEVLYKELQLQMMQALILVVYGKKKERLSVRKCQGGLGTEGIFWPVCTAERLCYIKGNTASSFLKHFVCSFKLLLFIYLIGNEKSHQKTKN